MGPIEADVAELVRVIGELLPPALRGTNKLRMFFSSGKKKEQAAQATAALAGQLEVSRELVERIAQAIAALEADPTLLDAAWADYERRSVAYNELLAEIGGLAPPAEAAHGFIPNDVVARVEAQPLDTSLLKVKLRGYQAFGAKFALVQQRSMVGDEMGLGKTIEALAVACHLAAAGERHVLVVCPASVLVNWSHEIERHTQLQAHRLHGSDKGDDVAEWVQAGGVGVTTFETLAGLGAAPEGLDLGLLVVDEAHYVKNPSTRRTKAVVSWIPEARRTLFLTGTPMENRVEEFRTLVRHLKPDVAAGVQSIDGLAGAATFRAGVASVYLRRNQTDVLLELPPRIETEDWMPLVGADLDAYRMAVAEGNFMRMRRAAYAPGTVEGSAKLDRLMEIVEEAVENGRKVVVFTFFRDVIATVMTALGPHGVGPITGDVPPIAPAAGHRRLHRPRRRRGARRSDRGERRRPQHPDRQRGRAVRAAVEAERRGAGDRPLPPHGPAPTGRGAPPAQRGQRRRAHAPGAGRQVRAHRRVREEERHEGGLGRRGRRRGDRRTARGGLPAEGRAGDHPGRGRAPRRHAERTSRLTPRPPVPV